MQRVHLLAAAGLAALLAACDQVRLPGVDNASPETPAAEETDVIAAEAGPAAPETDTATATEGETPTVDRDAPDPETGDAALADPAGMTGLGAVSLRPTLALYNASICGQPVGAAPTPTVAAVAGATELEEPVAGVEAVNALAASLAAFPGIVKLEPRRADETGLIASGHCSAVRIRASWFVTAAHCVDQPYDEIRLIGDAANLRSPAARITAAETALCHGGYLGTDNGYSNDIALLRLSPEQAARITAVPVARSGTTSLALAPANYPTGEMAGWGLTRFGGQLSNDL
uniref:trypsin-like serine protease n=1 Tax=Hyphomonas sp. TaxID=87 RepID=UPI0037BF1D47